MSENSNLNLEEEDDVKEAKELEEDREMNDGFAWAELELEAWKAAYAEDDNREEDEEEDEGHE